MRTREAIDFFGGQSALARALGLQQPSIAEWDEYPPAERQIAIELITNGKLQADLTEEERRELGRLARLLSRGVRRKKIAA